MSAPRSGACASLPYGRAHFSLIVRADEARTPIGDMNYRHAYHAGNFADVFKHAVLARILTHLRAKPAAFRVIDTHAGAGRYDLAGPEATRSLEWRAGIGRLLSGPVLEPVRSLLAPYLDVVSDLNSSGRLATYPG